ncbi:MAG TPA: hypothetical protein VK968_09780 [Roseimicrobium sp.]|nr:hypothetical protein [Roseimicrobium sp.]
MPDASQTGDFQIRTERLWSSVAPIIIGECPGEPGIPDEIVFIDRGQEPFMRLHIHYPPLEYHLKTEAKIWGGWVVVGFAGRVVLVSIHDGVRREIALSDVTPPDSFDYFCQLFSDDDVLLACSGRRIFRIGADGGILWKSDELGLDGVLVHHVDSTAISGNGEWDPPGGWRPFTVSPDTGVRISG